MPTPQNGQTHSSNSSATADELSDCVSSFYGVGLFKRRPVAKNRFRLNTVADKIIVSNENKRFLAKLITGKRTVQCQQYRQFSEVHRGCSGNFITDFEQEFIE